MSGATVTMAHWLGGRVQRPSVLTNGSGSYRISFTASPLGNQSVATAQVVADGYEEYWRSLKTDGRTTFVENFRLTRITRVAAGDSIVLSLGPDLGLCRGELSGVCATVRIMVPKAGRLTIEAVPNDTTTERPLLEVCCDQDGGERYGNPVIVTVIHATELDLEIGLGQGIATTRSFKVKTSFEAF